METLEMKNKITAINYLAMGFTTNQKQLKRMSKLEYRSEKNVQAQAKIF